jgi:uncharacterized protein
VFFLAPEVLQYGWEGSYWPIVGAIGAGTLLVAWLANRALQVFPLRNRGLSVGLVAQALAHAALIAIPEEILFRGLIQGGLQPFIPSLPLLVLGSSLIFGLAHLPNGAWGWRIRQWNWNFARVAFLVGLPLGLLYALTGSLLAPTLLHMLLLMIFKLFAEERK